MSDFDDAIGTMTTDLLTEAGGSFVYIRGRTSTTITLDKRTLPSMIIEPEPGMQIEITPVDFKALTIALPYDPPERGDKITGGGMTFEVMPTVSEKVYRRISQQMTRIHTKQVG